MCVFVYACVCVRVLERDWMNSCKTSTRLSTVYDLVFILGLGLTWNDHTAVATEQRQGGSIGCRDSQPTNSKKLLVSDPTEAFSQL